MMPSVWASAIASQAWDHRDRLRDRQALLALQELRQVEPFEILHHQERHAAFGGADVGHARHVLALYLYGRAGLAQESRHRVVLAAQVRK